MVLTKLFLAAVIGVMSTAPALAQDHAAEIAQLKMQNAELRQAIEDLKYQRTIGGLQFDRERLGKVAGGGFTVAVLSWFAGRWANGVGGIEGRVVGVIALGGLAAGAVVTAVAGLGYVLLPSPANANEFTNAFVSGPEGFNMIMREETDVILGWCAGEPALGEAILNLDRQVKAMQGRN